MLSGAHFKGDGVSGGIECVPYVFQEFHCVCVKSTHYIQPAGGIECVPRIPLCV